MGTVDATWTAWALENAANLPDGERAEFEAIVARGNQVECANAVHRFFGAQGRPMTDHPATARIRAIAEKQAKGDPSVMMPNQPEGGITLPALEQRLGFNAADLQEQAEREGWDEFYYG